MAESGRLWRAYQDVLAGRISRRAFMQRAMALGVTGPIAWGLLSAADVSAQEASPTAGGVPAAPTSGTDGQTRGAGGELKLLQWQAPTTLNMQLAGSFKD
ncbi:MAG TPA: hypothetical protein VFI22_16335, partial [Thermomicrobiales bacterium]|nr:hypothetical protein [Thermomicrobiales bacterium]